MKHLIPILIALIFVFFGILLYEIGHSHGYTKGYIAAQTYVIARLDELLDAKERMNP